MSVDFFMVSLLCIAYRIDPAEWPWLLPSDPPRTLA